MVVLRAGKLLIIIAARLRHFFNIDATALDSDCAGTLDSHFADVALGRLLFLLFNHRSCSLRVSRRLRHDVPIDHLHGIEELDPFLLAKERCTDSVDAESDEHIHGLLSNPAAHLRCDRQLSLILPDVH